MADQQSYVLRAVESNRARTHLQKIAATSTELSVRLSTNGPTRWRSETEIREYLKRVEGLGELGERVIVAFREGVSKVEPPPPPTPPSGGVPPFEELEELCPRPSQDVHSEWGSGLPLQARDTRFTMSQSAGSIVNVGGTGPGGIQAPFRETAHDVEGCWFDGEGAEVRWGLHCYGRRGPIRRSRFRGIRGEHGEYNKSCWDASYQECLFEDIGSQASQFVWRQHEAVEFERYRDPFLNGDRATLEFIRCGFREVGQPTGGRPSYAISVFEPTYDQGGARYWTGEPIHRDVNISACRFDSHEHTNHEGGGNWGSYGAIMVHAHRKVTLDGNVLRHRTPNRAVVQVWGCDELVVNGGEYTDPYGFSAVVFDIRGVRRVEFRGVSGVWRANVYGMNCPWYFSQPIEPHLVRSASGEDFVWEAE